MADDDNEAFELLKKILNEQTQVKFYFYFDPATGKIMHLRNYFAEDEFPYLEFSEIEENIDINNYLILEKDGKRQLIKKETLVDNLPKIDNNIHQIPKQDADPKIKISQVNYQFDALIEQDNIAKEFRIRLSGPIKDQYNQSGNSRQRLVCYVTAENDPNILYKILEVSLSDLLKYHYYTIPYDEDFNGTTCNIFSTKYFQNYLHLVIK